MVCAPHRPARWAAAAATARRHQPPGGRRAEHAPSAAVSDQSSHSGFSCPPAPAPQPQPPPRSPRLLPQPSGSRFAREDLAAARIRCRKCHRPAAWLPLPLLLPAPPARVPFSRALRSGAWPAFLDHWTPTQPTARRPLRQLLSGEHTLLVGLCMSVLSQGGPHSPTRAPANPAASCSNKEPILAVLKEYLAGGSSSGSGSGAGAQRGGLFLECASGTGQHCAYFAAALPHLTFQPTEYAEEDMSRRVKGCGGVFVWSQGCWAGGLEQRAAPRCGQTSLCRVLAMPCHAAFLPCHAAVMSCRAVHAMLPSCHAMPPSCQAMLPHARPCSLMPLQPCHASRSQPAPPPAQPNPSCPALASCSIAAWTKELPNVRPPLRLDASQPDSWAVEPASCRAVFVANM